MAQQNFLELVRKRTSVRSYSAQPIEQEKLDYVMESVRLAPSACNNQPWSFIIIKDKERLAQLVETYPRDWFRAAPACIVACGNHTESWKRPHDGKDHCDIDVSIAVTHLTLAAAEQGLGTCWVCHFDAKRCSEIFNLPAHIEPVALIPIGYPKDDEVFINNVKNRKSNIIKTEKT
ncbi:nitroreductase [Bacteroidia bacterium]|nr:nitroreductase [Bacteroidia bacterium]